jgi:hypothetical protein
MEGKFSPSIRSTLLLGVDGSTGTSRSTSWRTKSPSSYAESLHFEPNLDSIGPARSSTTLGGPQPSAFRNRGAHAMNDADFRSVATARLRWWSPAEGGRRSVPPGPIFAATARVGSDPGLPPVSVTIRYRGDVPSFGAEFDADVAFLTLELVKNVLAPGAPCGHGRTAPSGSRADHAGL